MVCVAGIDILPGNFHTGNFVEVLKLGEEGIFKSWGNGAGKNPGDIHIGVASASEAEVDNADDFVV